MDIVSSPKEESKEFKEDEGKLELFFPEEVESDVDSQVVCVAVPVNEHLPEEVKNELLPNKKPKVKSILKPIKTGKKQKSTDTKTKNKSNKELKISKTERNKRKSKNSKGELKNTMTERRNPKSGSQKPKRGNEKKTKNIGSRERINSVTETQTVKDTNISEVHLIENKYKESNVEDSVFNAQDYYKLSKSKIDRKYLARLPREYAFSPQLAKLKQYQLLHYSFALKVNKIHF